MRIAELRGANLYLHAVLLSDLILTIACGGVPSQTAAPSSSISAITASAGTSAGVPHSAAITASPSQVDFGQVQVGSTATFQVTVSNTGNADGTIDSATLNGAGFQLGSTSFPFTVRSGASVVLPVYFAPSSTGAATGNLILASTPNSSLSVALAGSAVAAAAPVSHQVMLSWDPSTSLVDGYYVYRSTQTGGPYARINSALVPTPSYTDPSVTGGATYFYVVTAVASSVESGYSNESVAAVPSP